MEDLINFSRSSSFDSSNLIKTKKQRPYTSTANLFNKDKINIKANLNLNGNSKVEVDPKIVDGLDNKIKHYQNSLKNMVSIIYIEQVKKLNDLKNKKRCSNPDCELMKTLETVFIEKTKFESENVATKALNSLLNERYEKLSNDCSKLLKENRELTFKNKNLKAIISKLNNASKLQYQSFDYSCEESSLKNKSISRNYDNYSHGKILVNNKSNNSTSFNNYNFDSKILKNENKNKANKNTFNKSSVLRKKNDQYSSKLDINNTNNLIIDSSIIKINKSVNNMFPKEKEIKVLKESTLMENLASNPRYNLKDMKKTTSTDDEYCTIDSKKLIEKIKKLGKINGDMYNKEINEFNLKNIDDNIMQQIEEEENTKYNLNKTHITDKYKDKDKDKDNKVNINEKSKKVYSKITSIFDLKQMNVIDNSENNRQNIKSAKIGNNLEGTISKLLKPKTKMSLIYNKENIKLGNITGNDKEIKIVNNNSSDFTRKKLKNSFTMIGNNVKPLISPNKKNLPSSKSKSKYNSELSEFVKFNNKNNKLFKYPENFYYDVKDVYKKNMLINHKANMASESLLAYDEEYLKKQLDNPLMKQLFNYCMSEYLFIEHISNANNSTLIKYCDLIAKLIVDYKTCINLIYRIKLFLNLSAKVVSSLNFEEAIEQIINNCCEVLNCERASIFMFDEVTDCLVVYSGAELNKGDIRIAKNKGLVGHCFTNKIKMNVDDPYRDERFNQEIDKKRNYLTRNVLCCPIKSKNGNAVGVIQVLNKNLPKKKFNKTDEELIEIFSYQTSVYFQNTYTKDQKISFAYNLKNVIEFSITLGEFKSISLNIDKQNQEEILSIFSFKNIISKILLKTWSSHYFSFILIKSDVGYLIDESCLKEVQLSGIIKKCFVLKKLILSDNMSQDLNFSELIDLNISLPVLTIPIVFKGDILAIIQTEFPYKKVNDLSGLIENDEYIVEALSKHIASILKYSSIEI